ncbi:MAG: hypothetical protein IH602_11180 [Bryobacteraceae bacterium]|nr:hypothetical protein [Bryobacteraceae bacterium]
MAASSEPSPGHMRFAIITVAAALGLLLAQVAFIADSPFTRQSMLAGPALICVFMLAVAAAFCTIRAQFALRERDREGSLDSFTRSTHRHCLIGNLAALACASASLGFAIFVLSHFSR